MIPSLRSDPHRRVSSPGARLFDFDHARADAGEKLRAERACENAGEIGSEDAFEWAPLRPAHRYDCLRESRSASARRRMLTTLWISVP
jgi:hypothetical protein